MTVSITIPDAIAPALVDNICAATGWTAESGKTKAVWAKAQLINWLLSKHAEGASIRAVSAATADAGSIT